MHKRGVGVMKQVQQIEAKLEGVFKDFPKLPKSGKDGLVGIMPWLALIFGVLQIFAAWGVWSLARNVDRLADTVNNYAAFYTAQAVTLSGVDRAFIYLGAIVLLVSGVIGVMAYKPLLSKERRGWDLLFLASFVNLGYSIIAIFINGRGFGSFVISLVGTAIGFYLLFQIKDVYTKKSTAPKAPTT